VVQQIAVHIYRLSLSSPDIASWTYIPGQTLNVFFGLTTRAEATSLRKRTYSIWGYDATAGQLELAVCTLSDSPGAQWAAEWQPGDVVHFYGPGGKFLLTLLHQHMPYWAVSRGWHISTRCVSTYLRARPWRASSMPETPTTTSRMLMVPAPYILW